jgi:hypothetical protein
MINKLLFDESITGHQFSSYIWKELAFNPRNDEVNKISKGRFTYFGVKVLNKEIKQIKYLWSDFITLL